MSQQPPPKLKLWTTNYMLLNWTHSFSLIHTHTHTQIWTKTYTHARTHAHTHTLAVIHLIKAESAPYSDESAVIQSVGFKWIVFKEASLFCFGYIFGAPEASTLSTTTTTTALTTTTAAARTMRENFMPGIGKQESFFCSSTPFHSKAPFCFSLVCGSRWLIINVGKPSN